MENLYNPEINRTQKVLYNNFILQNLFMKKENEIFNLEHFFKEIKNHKPSRKNKTTINGQLYSENKGEITPIPNFSSFNLNINILTLHNNLYSTNEHNMTNNFIMNEKNKEEELVIKKLVTD